MISFGDGNGMFRGNLTFFLSTKKRNVFNPTTILIKYFLGYSLQIIVESEANTFLKGLNIG